MCPANMERLGRAGRDTIGAPLRRPRPPGGGTTNHLTTARPLSHQLSCDGSTPLSIKMLGDELRRRTAISFDSDDDGQDYRRRSGGAGEGHHGTVSSN